MVKSNPMARFGHLRYVLLLGAVSLAVLGSYSAVAVHREREAVRELEKKGVELQLEETIAHRLFGGPGSPTSAMFSAPLTPRDRVYLGRFRSLCVLRWASPIVD